MAAPQLSATPAKSWPRKPARRAVLPGLGLTLGFTVAYLSLVVLIPLSALVFKAVGMSAEEFWQAVTAPRVLASFRLSFAAALVAAAVNALAGTLVAWVLVRIEFPGRRLVDALVDLPFALPTAVAGIALTALLAGNGWIGRHLEPLGVQIAFQPAGVVVALVFIGLPFVVRTVQPVLQELDRELEEASATLGATAAQTLWRVVLPALVPALLTGFSMALARGVGEYGSVIFIAGNVPMVSEIVPLVIVGKLEQYDYRGAAAVASVMLAASFVLLALINAMQAWQRSRAGGGAP